MVKTCYFFNHNLEKVISINIKNINLEAKELVMIFQRTQVLVLSFTRRLTTVCNSSLGVLDTLFQSPWASDTYMMQINIQAEFHTHKIKN